MFGHIRQRFTILFLIFLSIDVSNCAVDCFKNRELCFCDMPMLLNEIVNQMTKAPHPDVIRWNENAMVDLIQSMGCLNQFYKPLPSHLEINPTTARQMINRRYQRVRRDISSQDFPGMSFKRMIEEKKHSRNKREVFWGYPSHDNFQKSIVVLPDLSSHQYVPLGQKAVLPCSDTDEYRTDVNRDFTWIHSSGKIVNGPETTIDPGNGDLTIQAVQLQDTDIYTCQIKYPNSAQDDYNKDVPQDIKQQLDVVVERIYWLRVSIIYDDESTSNCDQEELHQIQEHIAPWIHQYVCHYCQLRNISVNCVHRRDSDSNSDVRLNFAISSLGIEYKLRGFRGYDSNCHLECLNGIHFKILETSKMSLLALFGLKIHIIHPGEATSIYTPEANNIVLISSCPSGFYETYKLCFPCPAGQFSPDGETDCYKCPKAQYQPTPGSGSCFDCPEGYGTFEEGSIAEYDCKLEAFVEAVNGSSMWKIITIITAIFVPILLLVCLIPCMCPKSKLGRCFASISCCGPNPDEYPLADGEKGNNKRRSSGAEKYKRIEEESSPLSATSEDDENAQNIIKNTKGSGRLLTTAASVTNHSKATKKSRGMRDLERLGVGSVGDNPKGSGGPSPGERSKNVGKSTKFWTEKNTKNTKAKSPYSVPQPPPLPPPIRSHSHIQSSPSQMEQIIVRPSQIKSSTSFSSRLEQRSIPSETVLPFEKVRNNLRKTPIKSPKVPSKISVQKLNSLPVTSSSRSVRFDSRTKMKSISPARSATSADLIVAEGPINVKEFARKLEKRQKMNTLENFDNDEGEGRKKIPPGAFSYTPNVHLHRCIRPIDRRVCYTDMRGPPPHVPRYD